MPGIYSKPPRRSEFASDICCLVEAATECLRCGGNFESYVQTLADEIEKERNKAREEAVKECVPQSDTVELSLGHDDDGAKRRAKMQLFIARKEMEVAEVFFECGVHNFFCKVIEVPEQATNPAVFVQLFNVYEVFQLVEVDPFDDDLGLMSLLTYFLSERHAYYIDINWKDNELSHMQLFLSALLHFISFKAPPECNSTLSRSTVSDASTDEYQMFLQCTDTWDFLQLTAIRLLRSTLWTFPPHRVLKMTALLSFRLFAFAGTGDENGLRSSFFRSLYTCTTPPLKPRLVLSGVLVHRLLRCPCSTCEFHRRLLKLSRNRDELGVQGASEAKRQVCYALVRGGVGHFLEQALNAARTAAGNAQDLSVSLTGIFQAAAWILLLCSWAYEEVHQGHSILSANQMKLMKEILETLEFFYCLPSSALERSCDDAHSSLLRVVISLLLRAGVAERRSMMHMGRPTFVKLAASLCSKVTQLTTLNCSEEKTGEDTGVDSEHEHAATCGEPVVPSYGHTFTFSHLAHETPQHTGLMARKRVAALLNSDSTSAVAVNDAVLDPKERALKSSMVLFGLMVLLFDPETGGSSLPCRTATDQLQQNDEQQLLPPATIQLFMESCQSLLELYEYLHPRFAHLQDASERAGLSDTVDLATSRAPEEATGQAGFDPREFFLGVVGLMAVLMGSLALQGVEQKRWRFIPNPAANIQPANAGGFASAARATMTHYSKMQNETCQTIKKLAGLVILRSEQAAGMVLRSQHLSAT
ncbi:uncharacterized protein LOC34623268 [Cyclospora cayetanensis]|uniref:Uncharacterized protein LOC34623268 n=1 Tax=Cyclospora cayetanensis TaxID=88456 RepID=A0A6P6RTP2_9EIME|nr:uncharacterized protein LOC34623268 [Cyclospora cayetanensis]